DQSLVQPVCRDDFGSFTLSFAGGSPGKRLTLTSTNGFFQSYDDEFSGTYLFEDLQPGPYIWTLEDQGCPDQSGTFTVNDILKPQFNSNFQDISCFGADDGFIQITNPMVQGGRTFSVWINGVNQGTMTDFFNLGPGIYQIRIQDSMGCISDPMAVELSQPDRPLEILNLSVTDLLCYGEEEGEIMFEVSGGRPSYRAMLTTEVGSAVTMDNLTDDNPYTFSGLAAGNFTLEVWDQNDICYTTEEIVIEEPGVFSTTLEVGAIFCEGGTTFLELETEGGVLPYVYQWEWYDEDISGWVTLPEVGNRINNATAGTYRYTVQETNGCLILSDTVDIPDGNRVELDFQAEDILCYGGTAAVTFTATSLGSGPFTYYVNGAQIFGNQLMAQAGSYVAYAVDNINGCVSEDLFFDLTQPTAPFAIETYTSTNLTCFEAGDGSIYITLTGGTGPYTISFLGNTVNASENEEVIFGNLSAGIAYEIGAIDANGCVVAIPPSVLSQPLPLQAFADFDPIVCYEGTTSISLEISGGTQPYQISWSYSEDGLDFYPLPTIEDQFILYDVFAGFYTYTLSDQGCDDIVNTLEIDQPTEVILTGSSTDVSCYGGNDGSLAFSPSGGASANYRIFVNGLELTGNAVNELSAGIYTAFAMSGSCRSENIQVSISQPDSPLAGDLNFPDAVLCHNDLSQISVQVSGGTAPYTAFLGTNEVLLDEPGLAIFEQVNPGNHGVRVVDALGCEWTEDFSILEPGPLEIFTEDIIDVSCFEGENGEVRTSVSGGTGTYTYTWSDDEGNEVGNTRHLSGVSAGTYSLTVTDENACAVTEIFEITEPGSVTFSYSTLDVTCYEGQNGRIEVSGTGGSPGYHLVIDGIQYPGLIADGLVAKDYSVYLTDAAGCVSPAETITIEEPLPLMLDVSITDVSCYTANNGEVAVAVSGGTGPYKIRWSDGHLSMNRTGMAPGNYEMVVTDANGCTIRDNVVITEPDPVLVTPTITDVRCFGGGDGRVALEISGGSGNYTVSWQKMETGESLGTGDFMPNLEAGIYEATITDAEGCELTRVYTVSEPNAPISVEPIIIDVQCAGEDRGSADLIVTGGTAPYTYRWSSGETTRAVQNKAGGVYQVEITDARGCVFLETIEIEEPEPIQVSETLSDVTCKFGSDGSIDLDISGGTGTFQVIWSNGMNGSAISGLRAGDYTAFVMDEQSCFESYTYKINEPEEPLSVTGQSNTELCFSDDVISLELTVKGGTAPYSYEWSNQMTAKDLLDIAPGNYTVRVTDAMGCLVEESFNVPGPSSPMDVQLTGKFGICSNEEKGEIAATVNGGQAPYAFLWSNGATTSSLSNLGSGVYRLEVTDARGCWVEETVEIIRPGDLNVSLEAINGVSCFGANDGFIQIAIHNNETPFKISWSHGVEDQLAISNLSGGIYTARIEDSVGCVTTVAYQIREPESLTYYETVENISCFGEDNGAITLEVGGGTAPYRLEWSNGATSRMIRDLSPGSYSVRITDRMGCTSLGEFRVAEPEVLEVEVSYSELLVCFGDENGFINLDIKGGVQPYRINWSDRPELGTQNRNGLEAGSYTVMVTDDNHCSQVLTLEIEEPDRLEAQLNTRLEVDCE
ncbi:MAG: SprB repeat-containing protein, partial [Cyclobacteriaceae bacterium]